MRSILFSSHGWEDYVHWQTQDKKMLKRINQLIKDIDSGNPFDGIGKPEPLKYDLQGYWSRRIDDANRVVYTVTKTEIIIVQCRFHYGDK